MMNKIEIKFKDINEQIEKVALNQADLFLKGLDEKIKRALDSALYSLLGLENRYNGQMEIDHCNGRNSVFIDLIRDKAKKEVEALISRMDIKKEDVLMVREAFNKEYQKQLRYQIEYYAKEIAKKHIEESTKGYVNRKLKELGIENIT